MIKPNRKFLLCFIRNLFFLLLSSFLFHQNLDPVLGSEKVTQTENPSNCLTEILKFLGHKDLNMAKMMSYDISPTIVSWEQKQVSSQFPIAYIDPNLIEVRTADKFAEELEVYLTPKDNKFPWIKHVHNTDESVPFQNAQESGDAIKVIHTASRTVDIKVGDKVFGLKMATNFPFGKKGTKQKGKASLIDDINHSLNRTKLIDEINAKNGDNKRHIILRESVSVVDKKTGNGYIFREYDLDPDKIYLPGHQVPYLLKDEFKANGVDIYSAYGKAIGDFQAYLLVNQGKRMKFSLIYPKTRV